MFLVILSVVWLGLFFFFLKRFGRAYIGHENLDFVKAPQTTGEEPFVTLIVPARDESENIEPCLHSLLKQSYPSSKYKIVVVDDNSTDDTRDKVRGVQTRHPNIELIEAGELPPGWAGKNHACWRGAKHAEGDWYCFVDADTKAGPELIRYTVSFSISEGIDVLSINPFQELVTLSEKLFLPATFLIIASKMDFKKVNDPSEPEYGANGQFLLFRRSTYQSINGHYAVKSEVMEDMAFARLIKKSGFRLYWMFGEGIINTRMYRGLSQIWEGFSKNMVEITGDKSLSRTSFRALESISLGWMPLILPVLAFYGLCTSGSASNGYLALGLSFLPSLAIIPLYMLTLKALKISMFYVFFFPLGFTMSALLTAASLWKKKGGKRRWKGRIYD